MRRGGPGLVLVAAAVGAVAACSYDWSVYDSGPSSGSSGSVSASSSATGSSSASGGGEGGSGAGGAASSSSGTTASSSSGSGGAPFAYETCNNGADDDGDGHADCAADPKCACGASGTMGWTGPYAVAVTDSAVALPDCAVVGGSLVEDVIAGTNDADPATCSACACGAPAGSCAAPTVTTYGAASCMGASVQTLNAASCSPMDGVTAVSVDVSASPPNTACPQTGAVPTVGSYTWSDHGRICDVGSAASPDCGANTSVCVPNEGAFKACITHVGIKACPAGAYTVQTVVYESDDDQRDCTGCSCGADSGVTCGGVVHFYSDVTCTTGVGTIATGTCGAIGDPVAYKFVGDPPSGGSCNPQGAPTPTGDVVGANELTICCLP